MGLRPGLVFETATGEGGDLCLRFHGKTVRMPGSVESAVRHMASEPTFSPSILPDDLSVEGRLTLVRRLVKEGFLTVLKRPEP